MLNESHAEFWWACRLSPRHPSNGGDYFSGRGILQQITANSQANASQENIGVFIHSKKDDLDLRNVLEEFANHAGVAARS
jgi:hypothetical protein